MKRLRIIVIGCTSLAKNVITALEQLPDACSIMGVVNLDPELGASKSRYDMLTEFSVAHPGDLFFTRDINDDPTISWIRERNPNIIIQCGWSQIFRETILSIPDLFCIGIHPSPLPIGRGAAVINWKIIKGGGPWGNTLFIMERRVDTGGILDSEPFTIEERDTCKTAYLKCDRTAVRMIQRTIPRIAEGTHIIRGQHPIEGSVAYRKRKPEDGLLQKDWSAKKILTYIKALTEPFPGAFFRTQKGSLIIWSATVGPSSDKEPGTILDIESGKGLLLQVGEGSSVWLELITPEGDLACWSDEWAKESNLFVGENIVSE